MVLPYPRSVVIDEDVFFDPAKVNDPAVAQKLYQRKISKDAKVYKFQYMSLEEALVRAFQFISPAKTNAQTFSTEFASIIKGAANLYELISKHVYSQLYILTNEQSKRLNVKNYLSLDLHLNFSRKSISSLLFFDEFDIQTEIYKPFRNVEAWYQNNQNTYIPKWWSAYNKIKHSNEGLEHYATLENAIASVGAVFIVINTIYGPGVVSGALLEPGGNIHLGIGSRVLQLL